MSVKYKALKRIFKLVNVQRIMAQPYDKLQKTFKTAAAQPDIPELSHPEFDFSVFEINGFPVLYVKHKNPAKGVCVFVTAAACSNIPNRPRQRKWLHMLKNWGAI